MDVDAIVTNVNPCPFCIHLSPHQKPGRVPGVFPFRSRSPKEPRTQWTDEVGRDGRRLTLIAVSTSRRTLPVHGGPNPSVEPSRLRQSNRSQRSHRLRRCLEVSWRPGTERRTTRHAGLEPSILASEPVQRETKLKNRRALGATRPHRVMRRPGHRTSAMPRSF